MTKKNMLKYSMKNNENYRRRFLMTNNNTTIQDDVTDSEGSMKENSELIEIDKRSLMLDPNYYLEELDQAETIDSVNKLIKENSQAITLKCIFPSLTKIYLLTLNK